MLSRLTGDRVRFEKFQLKWVDGWIGYYLGDFESKLSGIWRKVYVCPLPYLCFEFRVFCPSHYLTPEGIKKGDDIEVYIFSQGGESDG